MGRKKILKYMNKIKPRLRFHNQREISLLVNFDSFVVTWKLAIHTKQCIDMTDPIRRSRDKL